MKHKTDIILEKLQGSQARYRKGSYRRSYCICLINLLHRLLSVDFVPRNYTNKTVFTDRREGRGGKVVRSLNLMISNNAEQLKQSWTVSVELMNFLNYYDKSLFHNLKEKTTTLRNQEKSQFVI